MIRPDVSNHAFDPGQIGWLVAVGDVNEGWLFYGPFESAVEADKWAQKQIFSPHYVLVRLLRASP